MSNFYVGGVPEEAEIKVLGPLEINQGFTGCIEIIKALIEKSEQKTETKVSYNSYSQIANSIKAVLVNQKNVKLCSSKTSCQQADQCDTAGNCVELPVDDYVCQKAPAELKTSTNQMAFNGHRYDHFLDEKI